MDINIFALKEYARELQVLYVEDDEAVKAQIVIFLQKFFPSIVTAKDGVEGLELYKQGKYDIVITDIMMPRMDGMQMSKAIKEINEEQVIIVTSAYNETEKLMELINIGVDKFVMKPISNKPFLILLYNVAKSIHLAAQNKRLEKELVLKAKETEKIIDFMDNQIAVIENQKIISMNRAFKLLFGIENDGEVALSKISSRIDGRFGCKGDIIECLERNPFALHKAVIMDEAFDKLPRMFLIRHTALEANTKYLLTLTDITQIEKDIEALSKKLHTNPFTGLPNKEALREVAGELTKKGGEFGTVVFYIENLERIIAWHGKEKGLEVEKAAANELLEKIERLKLEKKPFVANFDKNFYVLICRPLDTKILSELIGSLDVMSHIAKLEHAENETIHSCLKPIALDERKFESVEQYFATLKQKYERIIF